MRPKGAVEAEIVRLLKGAGSFVSGEALSRGLGVSRTAVWKHINALKKSGYNIDSVTAKGYRLIPPYPFNDIEVASGISTGFVGKKVFFFERTDSTNRRAFELGLKGEGEGTAVIADAQDKGKGRLGRTWESPGGVNLYTSVILRPPIAPREAHELTFVMAIAVAETVAKSSGKRPTVKWPNDILINGKKAAGILLEMDSESDRVHFVVGGVGVNLNMRKKEFPPVIRETATSLFEETGVEIERAEFARRLYSSIELWYKIYLDKGFQAVLDAWRGWFDSEGTRVRVTSFDRVLEGICAGVDKDGALLVRTPSGTVERVISGDVEAAV